MERFKLLRWILKNQLEIRRDLQEIKRNMAKNTQDALNAIADLKTQVGQIGADLTKLITDLEAQIAAGAGQQDTQPLVDAIKDVGVSLTAIDTQIQTADGVPPVENQTA